MKLSKVTYALAIAVITALALPGMRLFAQEKLDPNAAPNPYRMLDTWAQLPEGRPWGTPIGVELDHSDGKSIWVFDRCGADNCAGSNVAPIMKFDSSGKLLANFGAGMFNYPHGLFVDREGNVWVTDGRGEGGKGHTVIKFAPDGKVLMTLGKPGVAGDGLDMLNSPSDVVVAPNGDIFVADGHGEKTNDRVVKFSKDGKFIKAWGHMGSEPGDFREPHDLYVGGSKGWVYVADRQNNRVQVFDQDGNFVAAWKQFGQPSAVYVDKNDNIYVGATYEAVAPGETALRPTAGPNDRAIVIGNAISGELKYLIPDPGDLTRMTDTGTSASGIAVDDQGNLYAADVGFNNLRKYSRMR